MFIGENVKTKNIFSQGKYNISQLIDQREIYLIVVQKGNMNITGGDLQIFSKVNTIEIFFFFR